MAESLVYTVFFRPTRSRKLFSLRGSFVSDILCSEECQTKKLLVCCKMFAVIKAIFDLFTNLSMYVSIISLSFAFN